MNIELILVTVGTITGILTLIISIHFKRKAIKQVDRDRKRTKILEEVQKVLTPAIDHLNSEIEAIRHKKIFWQRYPSGEYGFFDYRLRRLFNHPQYKSVRFSFEKSSLAVKDLLAKFFYLN